MHKILKEILNLKTDLNDLVRLGSFNDGGYVVNKSSLLTSNVLYTYGVSNDYNFELDYIKMYPEKSVKMFDHTVNYPFEVYKNVFFLKEALDINEDDTHNSFINHMSKFKDEDKKIFLKIDVEGYEYDFFLKISKNLHVFKNITGMVVEFHDLNTFTNYMMFQKIINKLSNYFNVTHLHGNNHGRSWSIDGVKYPEVLEISFCNLSLSNDFKTTRVDYPLLNLDSPCHSGLQDYIINI